MVNTIFCEDDNNVNADAAMDIAAGGKMDVLVV
jgi:hypothetical protein